MKNSKIYLFMISIYAIIAFCVLVYYLLSNQGGYLLFPNNTIYYSDKKNISFYDKKEKIQENVTIITEDGKKNSTIKLNNGIFEFYDKKEKISIDNFIVAYSSKLNINFQNYEKKDLNEEDIKKMNEVLKEHGIIGYENLNTNFKISFNNKQTLYFISNLFDETKFDKVFSFVYYIRDNHIVYLVEQVNQIEHTYDLCVPDIHAIFDMNHQEKIILSCSYFSDIGTNYDIYEWKNNEFHLINK